MATTSKSIISIKSQDFIQLDKKRSRRETASAERKELPKILKHYRIFSYVVYSICVVSIDLFVKEKS
jgi:hypothetical protein